MVVTFFGNRNTPQDIKYKLKETLELLIKNNDAKEFYFGNNGNFDILVKNVLIDIKKRNPNIECTEVLSRMPKEREVENGISSLFPYEVACSIPKFSINARNIYMINKSDIVVTYVARTFGGAYKFKKISERKGKIIIELFEK